MFLVSDLHPQLYLDGQEFYKLLVEIIDDNDPSSDALISSLKMMGEFIKQEQQETDQIPDLINRLLSLVRKRQRLSGALAFLEQICVTLTHKDMTQAKQAVTNTIANLEWTPQEYARLSNIISAKIIGQTPYQPPQRSQEHLPPPPQFIRQPIFQQQQFQPTPLQQQQQQQFQQPQPFYPQESSQDQPQTPTRIMRPHSEPSSVAGPQRIAQFAAQYASNIMPPGSELLHFEATSTEEQLPNAFLRTDTDGILVDTNENHSDEILVDLMHGNVRND